MIPVRLKQTLTLFTLLMLCRILTAQDQSARYNVFHNGEVVGQVTLFQRHSGHAVYIKMNTDIKVKMFMEVNVRILEESHIENGKLLSSTLNRIVNGKEKANRQTIAAGNGYQTIAEGKKGTLAMPKIDYNLIQLYCYEPVNRTRVYSDNFQQMINIKPLRDHVYRIDLPDGNYNEFTYVKGVCTYVSIHSTLYTIELKLA